MVPVTNYPQIMNLCNGVILVCMEKKFDHLALKTNDLAGWKAALAIIQQIRAVLDVNQQEYDFVKLIRRMSNYFDSELAAASFLSAEAIDCLGLDVLDLVVNYRKGNQPPTDDKDFWENFLMFLGESVRIIYNMALKYKTIDVSNIVYILAKVIEQEWLPDVDKYGGWSVLESLLEKSWAIPSIEIWPPSTDSGSEFDSDQFTVKEKEGSEDGGGKPADGSKGDGPEDGGEPAGGYGGAGNVGGGGNPAGDGNHEAYEMSVNPAGGGNGDGNGSEDGNSNEGGVISDHVWPIYIAMLVVMALLVIMIMMIVIQFGRHLKYADKSNSTH